MPNSMGSPASSRQSVIPDTGRPRMAKANVGNPDMAGNQAWNSRIGAAFARARAKVDWTIDQAARHMGVDPREVGKWESGARRVQTDRVMATEELREPFAKEFALLADGVTEVTQLRFPERRRA